ncbi:MAG: TolC family protein [Ferruginibacter sp.]
MKYYPFKFSLLLILLFPVNDKLAAQQLTLEECYQLAKQNYPDVQKLGLIEKSAELDIENAGKGNLPQINFTGKATYQSEVTNYADLLGTSNPAMKFPEFSKDQYKIQGEVSQLIYDGGNIKNQKSLIRTNSELEKQNIETRLYAIKERVNNLYFSVLLIDEQVKQNEINKANLQTQADKTEAQLKNGVAFRSNLNELKAEVLNIEMKSTELAANRNAYLKMLSLFVGKEINSSVQLKKPVIEEVAYSNNRPEIKAFDIQKSLYDIQEKQIRTELIPKMNAFIQGAYGRPNLNGLSNDFRPWYITGLQFSWNLGSLYTRNNRKKILQFSREKAEADKKTFLFNSGLDLLQQNDEVKKYKSLITQDKQVIELRESVTQSSVAQLNNGVITTYEYIQKLNNENAAKQLRILHEIQLLQAQYKQKFITGN